MQYQVTITVPDTFDRSIRSLENFDQFVSRATVAALKMLDYGGKKRRLTEAVRLMLADYRQDAELTCFTVLDGAAIYE